MAAKKKTKRKAGRTETTTLCLIGLKTLHKEVRAVFAADPIWPNKNSQAPAQKRLYRKIMAAVKRATVKEF